MTNILIIGAGRSSTSLIDYFLSNSNVYQWNVTVADMDLKLAQEKVALNPSAKAISFNIKDDEKRRAIIKSQDFIISMLPASMHADVARDCVEFSKHLATASYVSSEMNGLNEEAKKKNIILINECGLDPGIDHASAMKIIEKIKFQGGIITSFKSYCGGLVAPQSNDNPWGYKFSWNPRNVVLAGQGTTQYLQTGSLKFVPYNRLFSDTNIVEIESFGKFDAYPNRDSVSYKTVYGLNDVQTMIRGTLREYGYCKAWNVFVKLGLTDDSSKIINTNKLTYSSLIQSFLPETGKNLKESLRILMKEEWDIDLEKKMDYLELFSDKKITMNEGTPAQLLQHLLEEKLKLNSGDKDMIVMQHQFEYQLPNLKQIQKLNSSLVVIGENQNHTAMALTVGLPLAITVKNFLTKRFSLYGVQIPTKKEIYEPLLKELEDYQIIFNEQLLN